MFTKNWVISFKHRSLVGGYYEVYFIKLWKNSGWFWMRLDSCLKIKLHTTVCNTVSWLVSSKSNRHTTVSQRCSPHCVQLHVQWNKTGGASITHRFSLMETKWVKWLHAWKNPSCEFQTWHWIHSSEIRRTIFPKQNAQARGDSHTHSLPDAGVCGCVHCVGFAAVTLSTAPSRQECEHPRFPSETCGSLQWHPH